MSSSKLPPAAELALPCLLSDGSSSVAALQDEVLRLFDECGPGVRRYVRSFGLPAEAVEDVVQEVFLSLFRHLRLGRSRRNLRGWIFRVGHHLALKQRARAALQRRREGELDEALAERTLDPAADPEQRVVAAQRGRRLRAIIRALPERDRHCLYLRAEGLRYREIATTLEVSLGSVAQSLARAMARLIEGYEERIDARD